MPAFAGTGGAPVPTPRSSAIPSPKVTVAAHTRNAPTKKTGVPDLQPGNTTAPPFLGYLTPAQQQAQITSQVQASLLPQQTAIKNAASQDKTTAAAQQQAVQGYYTALAQILQGAAPQVNAGYQQAAGNDAAFSKGFTDGLAHVQTQAGQQNQAVENVAGSTPGQASDIANATGGSGVLDALYNATGYQPAINLTQQGAAAGAAASALPAVAGGLGGQAITQLGNQEQSNQNAFQQQLAALQAQVPSLTQQYGNQLASQQSTLANNQQATDEFSQQEDDRKTTIANAAHQNQINNAIKMIAATGVGPDGNLTPTARAKIAGMSGVDPTTGAPTLAATKAAQSYQTQQKQLALSQQRVNISQQQANTAVNALNAKNAPKYSASVSRSLGYSANQYGIPMNGKIRLLPGFGYDNKGNIVKVGTSSTTNPHGFTAAQTAKLKGQALTFAENAALGGAYLKNGKLAPAGTTGGYDAKGNPVPPLTREQALEKARQLGQPDWVALPALSTYYGSPNVVKTASKFFAGLGFNGKAGNG